MKSVDIKPLKSVEEAVKIKISGPWERYVAVKKKKEDKKSSGEHLNERGDRGNLIVVMCFTVLPKKLAQGRTEVSETSRNPGQTLQ